jgi:hypothetical protein
MIDGAFTSLLSLLQGAAVRGNPYFLRLASPILCRSIMVLRWFVLLFSAVAILASGCGGSASNSRSYNHLVAASEAINAGDKEKAFTELSASIDTSPSCWAYFERARINLDKGQEDAAVTDCQKGLELDPTSRELLWLSAELKKPAPQRFKGKLAQPPGRKPPSRK